MRRRACMHAEGGIQASMVFDKGVTLYTAGTPNGWKANMIVEELKVPYKLHAITLSENEQKQEWLLKINPNGRIPAIGELSFIFILFEDENKSFRMLLSGSNSQAVVQLTMMKETCQSLNRVQL